MAKQETEEPAQPKGQIVRDPELIAMQKIDRIIAKLPEKARVRVVQWLTSKIEFPILGGSNG